MGGMTRYILLFRYYCDPNFALKIIPASWHGAAFEARTGAFIVLGNASIRCIICSENPGCCGITLFIGPKRFEILLALTCP